MKVLISGFEPFGEEEVNPTAEVISSLVAKEIKIPHGLMVDQVLLPVTFKDSFRVLEAKINEFNPDVVICLGVASKRSTIDLESMAVNTIHTTIPDNNGMKLENEVITAGGPHQYLSTLPLQGIEGALQKAGLPVSGSTDAGTYVCNYVFYKLMETNQDTFRLCGFIHVPQSPRKTKENAKGLPLSDLFMAIEVILEYIDY